MSATTVVQDVTNSITQSCCRLDAYFEYGLGGPWDMAAGAVILTEAGGRVLDPSGEWRSCLWTF